MIYWQLFIGFLKVGCFSFGGAYGAIPLIRDVVKTYGWMTDEMLSTMIAVSESTPGPIMVNMATYVGSSQGGILGSLIATLASIVPAFIIILLAEKVMNRVLKNRYAKAVMEALKACVIGVITATGVELILKNVLPGTSGFDWRPLVLTLVLGTIYILPRYVGKRKSLAPTTLILISAVLGIAVYGI